MIFKFLVRKTASSYFYFVTAMFSFTILAASLMFLLNDYSNFRAAASYEIKAQSNNIRHKINDSLTYTKQIMSYVGKQVSAHGANDYKFINELLINYRIPRDGLLYWNIFAWVDKDHKVRVSSGMGILNEDVDLKDRTYLLLAKDTPETMHIGNPVIGKLSKIYSIPMSYGIVNSHREYIGSVIAGLVVSNLESQINSVISDDNVLFAITDNNGDIVAKSTKLDSGENKKIFNKILATTKANPKQELSTDFAYYQRLLDCSVECVNYGIITIYDNNTTVHRNMVRLAIYLLVASFAIAVAGFMLFGFYEHIIHPIAVLSEYTEKISRDVPNRQRPKFEVDELNQMAHSLHELDKLLWNKKK